MLTTRTDLAHHVGKAAVLTLAILLLVEVVAYFVYHENPAERLDFGYSENAGFKIRQNGQLEIRRTASRGLWNQSYPVVKPEGVVRVVLVGDSVLRGMSYEKSVAGVLLKKLKQCGVAAEVWSLASPGYGARRKDILVRKALAFKPDLLIYHTNITTEYEDAREWERRQRHSSWHPSLWPEKLPLIGRVMLSKTEKIYWKWLDGEIRVGSDKDGEELARALRSKGDIAYWTPRMLEELKSTLRSIHQAKVPLLILTRGNFVASRDQITDLGLDAQMARLSQQGEFVWMSTRQILGNRDPRPYFSDGSHWTLLGHETIAAALLPEALSLLAEKTPSASSSLTCLQNGPN